MARPRMLVPLLAITMGGIVLAVACGPDESHPPPLTTGVANPTSAAATSGSGADNPCECLSTIAAQAPATTCLECYQDTGPAGCHPEKQACDENAGCTTIANCLAGCDYTSECVRGCMLPFDKDEGHTLFEALARCVCNANVCGQICDQNMTVECTPLGAGGAGGAGGSGGAGSTTSASSTTSTSSGGGLSASTTGSGGGASASSSGTSVSSASSSGSGSGGASSASSSGTSVSSASSSGTSGGATGSSSASGAGGAGGN